MTDVEKKIALGKICSYCGTIPELVDARAVYNRGGYGQVWMCPDCGAYVGCHKNSQNHKTKPLGRLANATLRRKKGRAHSVFDRLWRKGRYFETRKDAYSWLAEKLGIGKKWCHIGMFDEETCDKVVCLCNDFIDEQNGIQNKKETSDYIRLYRVMTSNNKDVF